MAAWFPSDLLKKGNWGSCSQPDSGGSYGIEDVSSANLFALLAAYVRHPGGQAVFKFTCRARGRRLLMLSRAVQ